MGDLFILPSIKDSSGNMDGLPTVLLEAMATSLPIVASDIGGVDLVISNEVNGLLVKSGDIDLLAEKIKLFNQSPR